MRLGVVEFGRQLLRLKDLDPVYLALNWLDLDRAQLGRWLVAYWSFYHCGFACYASDVEGDAFWDRMLTAAENAQPAPTGGRWPRGSERRHSRGAFAVRSVLKLRERYGPRPQDMVSFVAADNVFDIMLAVKEHYGFGDWIAFKVADMLDAVWGQPVDQSNVLDFLYEAPRAAIERNFEMGAISPSLGFIGATEWLRSELSDCTIPHKPGQPLDWFCLETVWCKHGSHLSGHYPLGKDIREIRHGLGPWFNHSATATRFALALPKLPEEALFGGN